MSEGEKSYRVWLAGESTWEAGPAFGELALAIDRARRLAVTRWVAIELPSREWHVFDESQTTRLGPPQFARGSNLDLNDEAAAANDDNDKTDAKRRSREFPRASTGNNSYRVSGVRITRPVGTESEAANPAKSTASGLGPDTTHRRPASRTSTSQPAQRAPTATRQTGPQTTPPGPRRRGPRPSTKRSVNERRAAERFAADEVLGEPACYVDGQRVEVVDISETGLQIVLPPRTRLRGNSRIVLSFSDHHGRFDLVVKVVWTHANHAGVEIDEGGANTVGKMFVRKLIGQLVTKREARARRSKR